MLIGREYAEEGRSVPENARKPQLLPTAKLNRVSPLLACCLVLLFFKIRLANSGQASLETVPRSEG